MSHSNHPKTEGRNFLYILSPLNPCMKKECWVLQHEANSWCCINNTKAIIIFGRMSLDRVEFESYLNHMLIMAWNKILNPF